MSDDLLETLQSANREFQEFIEQVSQSDARVVETRGAMRRLVKIDLRLKHVSKCLASVPQSFLKSPEAAYEVMKYRANLKTLKGLMENLQFSLLAEKARLDNVRANMQAARAWAESVRELS
jgi:hypothetical protein